MTFQDCALVAAIASGVVIAANLIGAGITGLLARRPRRPPMPDVFLPDGWTQSFPDGQGHLRFYEWWPARGGWIENRRRRIDIPEDEPADS